MITGEIRATEHLRTCLCGDRSRLLPTVASHPDAQTPPKIEQDSIHNSEFQRLQFGILAWCSVATPVVVVITASRVSTFVKNLRLKDSCLRCELAFDSRFHVFTNPSRSSRRQTACLDVSCDIAERSAARYGAQWAVRGRMKNNGSSRYRPGVLAWARVLLSTRDSGTTRRSGFHRRSSLRATGQAVADFQ
jgi:hypothetical protein